MLEEQTSSVFLAQVLHHDIQPFLHGIELILVVLTQRRDIAEIRYIKRHVTRSAIWSRQCTGAVIVSTNDDRKQAELLLTYRCREAYVTPRLGLADLGLELVLPRLGICEVTARCLNGKCWFCSSGRIRCRCLCLRRLRVHRVSLILHATANQHNKTGKHECCNKHKLRSTTLFHANSNLLSSYAKMPAGFRLEIPLAFVCYTTILPSPSKVYFAWGRRPLVLVMV